MKKEGEKVVGIIDHKSKNGLLKVNMQIKDLTRKNLKNVFHKFAKKTGITTGYTMEFAILYKNYLLSEIVINQMMKEILDKKLEEVEFSIVCGKEWKIMDLILLK